jgi:two-component system, LytTR family, sensor kinase
LAHSLLSQARFRFAFLGAWVIWALLHALMIKGFTPLWQTALTDSFVSNSLLLLAGLLLMNTLRYYVPQQNRYVMLMAWVSVLSLIWLLLVNVLLKALLSDADYALLVKPALFIRFSIGFLITGNLVLVSVLWYHWQDQKAAEQRKVEADQLSKAAELFKLRQQLQPHFLFNSLNSINALIGAQPALARTMVLQLSDFLRGTLKKEEQQLVSLQEELDYLQLYLDIEKVRFGHRLSTALNTTPEACALQLPALLLQPVVENAIKFGLYDTLDNITIGINAAAKEGILTVWVQNPFDPQTSQLAGTGFGLSSIRRRLYLLYGRNDLLTTTADDHLFTTTLLIPQTAIHHL